MNFTKKLVGKHGQKDWDADATLGFAKAEAQTLLDKNVRRLAELQSRLYAEGQRALLIILQGMDASGKDGTIAHVMSGVNPQSCRVTSFKAPTTEELAHDFLWRIHKAVPARGEIGIFNRSHYEDVLIARVRKLVPKKVWAQRYAQINAFEALLAANGVQILKFFLHISKDEQRDRLQSRLDDPLKNWKFNPGDLAERKLWKDYQRAYADAVHKCNTKHAPWFVVPANKKWFRNLAVAAIIVETLEKLDPQFPKPVADLSKIVVR
ncbi:MAG: Polyphosphate:AMP/ADP phosphotransferase [Verrucomicrobiae bacterium]|nr:Polyphosphate:AMP/ADP phosphotransferase [Verrucomicrobiae bacterium]